MSNQMVKQLQYDFDCNYLLYHVIPNGLVFDSFAKERRGSNLKCEIYMKMYFCDISWVSVGFAKGLMPHTSQMSSSVKFVSWNW